MTTTIPISTPSKYVAPTAVGFADPSGNLILVGHAEPLPVATVRSAGQAPLAGSMNTSGEVGPFPVEADLPVHLQLSGDWTGTVGLRRSIDGGLSRHGVTAGGMPWAEFAGNMNEIVWQEVESGAQLYLDVQLTSGTLTYRISQ